MLEREKEVEGFEILHNEELVLALLSDRRQSYKRRMRKLLGRRIIIKWILLNSAQGLRIFYIAQNVVKWGFLVSVVLSLQN
jgi:hypothetical protein